MAAIASPPPNNPEPRSRNSFFSSFRRRLGFIQRPTTTDSVQPWTTSPLTVGVSSPPPNLYAQAHPVPFTKGPVFVYPDAYVEISEAYKKRWEAVVHLLKLNVQQSDTLREHKDNIDYDLQMCGLQPSEAFPHIVVHCLTKLAPHLHKLFLRPHVKRHYHVKYATEDTLSFPRFGLIIYGAEPNKISGLTHDVSITTQGLNPLVDSGLTMCGSRVISNNSPNRFSTIGCVLRVGRSFYGLTTAHTFVDDPVMDSIPSFSSFEDSDTEDDDYSYDFSSMATEFEPGYGAVTSFDKAFDSIDRNPLGQMTPTIQETIGESTPFWNSLNSKTSKVYVPARKTPQLNSDLDWAAVELHDSAHWRPNVYTSETAQLKPVPISPEYVTHLPPKAKDVLIISSRGQAVRGRIRSLPTIRGGPANQVNEFWVVSVQGKDTLARGDSGSIVVDAHNHKIYGHVVSINAYGDLNIVPMKDTIRQIEIMMGRSPVSLHSISDVELSQFLNVSIIDTQRLMREWSLYATTLRAHRRNTAADGAAAMSRMHRTSSLMQGLQKYLISTNTAHTTQFQSFPPHATSPPSLWTHSPINNYHTTTRHTTTGNIELQNRFTNLRGQMVNPSTTSYHSSARYIATENSESRNWFTNLEGQTSYPSTMKYYATSRHIATENGELRNRCINLRESMHREGKCDWQPYFDIGADRAPLAEGSFGTVYSIKMDCRDHNPSIRSLCSCNTSHKFALKTYTVDDPERLESFSTESEAFSWTQKLSHDNIVKYLGTYQIGDNTFGLLFPLANADLKTYMSSPRPTSTSGAVHIFKQIRGLANALRFLHSGLVDEGRSKTVIWHMDLKPSNILLVKDHANTEEYTWKIADFGLSKFHERASSTSIQTDVVSEKISQAQTAKVQGDRAYTAPEVELSNGRSAASDVWSFGCVLMECVIWLCAGNDALRRSKEAIAREDSEGSLGLWVQAGSAEVTLKPTVKHFLDLLGESADHEPSLLPLARLFRPGGVLDLDPEQRMDSAGIEDQLRSFIDQKDFEKGVIFLMNDLLSSETCDRLFPRANRSYLESGSSRVESQGTAGSITEDSTPTLHKAIPEKVQSSSLESSTVPPAAVQKPLCEIQSAIAEKRSLSEAGNSYEPTDRSYGPLRPDPGEKSHSAGDDMKTRKEVPMLPRRDSAPDQINTRSCPPKSITDHGPHKIRTLPRKMTPEEVRNADRKSVV